MGRHERPRKHRLHAIHQLEQGLTSFQSSLLKHHQKMRRNRTKLALPDERMQEAQAANCKAEEPAVLPARFGDTQERKAESLEHAI